MFEKIEQRRKELGITKTVLAVRAKTDVKHYNEIIKGNTGSIKKLVLICQFLNLKIEIV